MMNNVFEMMMFRQSNGKPMSKFHKQFKNMIDVVEGQWGDLCPMKMAENDGEEDDSGSIFDLGSVVG